MANITNALREDLLNHVFKNLLESTSFIGVIDSEFEDVLRSVVVRRDSNEETMVIWYKHEGLSIQAERDPRTGTAFPILARSTLVCRDDLKDIEQKLHGWYNKSHKTDRGRPDCFWVIDYKDGTKELIAVKDFKQNQLQLMYGNHNFSGCNSRVNWWAMTIGDNATTSMSSRVLPSAILSRFGNTQITGASVGTAVRTETGQWTTERLVARDNVYLVGRAMNQPGNETDAIILRLRRDAPLIKIEFRLSVDAQATYERLSAFMGRADIIPPEEAYNTHEFKEALKENDPMIPPLSWFAEEEDRLWESTEVMSGTPRPKMKAVFTGRGYKSVAVASSSRRIKLRR